MTMSLVGWISGALAVLGVGADAPFTAKVERAEPPAALSPAHRKLLDPETLTVRAGGDPVMRVVPCGDPRAGHR